VILGLPWLVITAIGPPLLYIVAQVAGSDRWRYHLRFLPLLVALGMGLSLSNTGAVLRAVLGVRGEFKRTPKFNIQQSADTWVGSMYALRGDWLVWAELLLAGMVLVLLAMPSTRWTFVPWLLLYATGFGYVALINLYQTYQLRRFLHGARQPRST
jgi:hypothetical protein